MKRFSTLVIFIFLALFSSAQFFTADQFANLKYRNVGPFRAGRSLAVAGHPSLPNTYYAGAVGGGLWKTTDGGNTWFCTSDTTFTSGSVGAVALAPSDPSIVFAGTGEKDIRGNISFGDGLYKSSNGGKKWKKCGLSKTYAISNIVIHPKNPDLVYVAALGSVFKPGGDRGLYRSKDGGTTWEKILYKSDSAGCIQVVMDPRDPNTLYASLWQSYRSPWSMSSGGRHSGLYKSTNGGDTWVLLSKNEGMPKGLLGKICMAVSPVDPDRLFAMVENENGGLFRSDNAGESWLKITEERAIRQRPWYFSAVFCHPKNKDIVFVLNVAYHKSTDGGKTFSTEWAQHADNHDLWIHPDNPDIMIMGNDGGATVTQNGGLSWTEQDYPTGQFYHVTIDQQFPYRLYGAQQDNTSLSVASRSFGWEIGRGDWFDCSWGESGYIAPHPYNRYVAFGGNYSGAIYRYDREFRHTTMVNVYPEVAIGDGALKLKERFQWTFPLFFSPHSTKERTILYATSQHVHRSYDEGIHWETISPDLTRNDPSKQQASGGPISKDNTGVEVFNTIFTLCESPVQPGILWAGSDDGLVHISRDNGRSWQNVTPSGLPENTQVSILEASHFKPGTAYLVANRFKLGEMVPFVFKTDDFGKTWKRIEKGLPANACTRVIREDPASEGLLFCGTETGIYLSMNDGATWQSFQQNLPTTPVHDLAIHPTEHDLVVCTHGRGFWIMDNISMLYELKNRTGKTLVCRNTYNAGGGTYETDRPQAGTNAPCGLVVDYLLPADSKKELFLKIRDGQGDSVAAFSSLRDKNYSPVQINQNFFEPKTTKPVGLLPALKGFNRFVWDMKTADLVQVEGDGKVMWGASLSGPMAHPGDYSVALYSGDSLLASTQCKILPDPRFPVDDMAAYLAKKALLDTVIRKVNEVHKAINQMRHVKKQINDFTGSLPAGKDRDTMIRLGKVIIDSITAIENELIQSKAKNGQDLLNYPVKLNNKLASLIDKIDDFKGQVPQAYTDAFYDLDKQVNRQLARYYALKQKEIRDFNAMAVKLKIDVIKTTP